jgi:hypothetical protein
MKWQSRWAIGSPLSQLLAIIVTARLRETAPPASVLLEQIRENALRSILSSETKG